MQAVRSTVAAAGAAAMSCWRARSQRSASRLRRVAAPGGMAPSARMRLGP